MDESPYRKNVKPECTCGTTQPHRPPILELGFAQTVLVMLGGSLAVVGMIVGMRAFARQWDAKESECHDQAIPVGEWGTASCASTAAKGELESGVWICRCPR